MVFIVVMLIGKWLIPRFDRAIIGKQPKGILTKFNIVLKIISL